MFRAQGSKALGVVMQQDSLKGAASCFNDPQIHNYFRLAFSYSTPIYLAIKKITPLQFVKIKTQQQQQQQQQQQ